MATHIVMDHTGDTRHSFDASDEQALAKAEERFKKLTGLGFTAAVRTGSGEVARPQFVRFGRRGDLVFPSACWRMMNSVNEAVI